MKRFPRYFYAITAVLCVLAACSERPRYIQISGYAQGGTYSVKMNVAGVKESPEAIRDAVDSILTLVDTTLSGYNKGSMLSRFNRGEKVVPNALFKDMYSFSKDWARRSEGALDVAAGPLFDAWGFGFTTDSLPSAEAVGKILLTCGMRRLKDSMDEAVAPDGTLSGADLVLPGNGDTPPRLNYNAVAQGYTCDLVASYLHSIGVKDMLVDIGEIFCEGVNPSGKPWNVGVDRPYDGNDSPGKDLDGIWEAPVTPVGIVTSGNYRKFYVKDGRKYSHTIDPRTGYPVTDSLLSATVVAPDAATADALATLCMVLGYSGAQSLILSDSTLEGYLIYDSAGTMKEWASPGFKVSH
ncbi:MAG: FAD:protein FMN transferase [Bacteroidales bacterium]|nr:FAD:protein FMN transferase [Bacteroidales bacterium]